MISIKIPWQVYACTGVMAILGAAGYYLYDLGRDHTQAKWDASVERGKAVVTALKNKQGSVTTKVETVYVDRVKTIKEKGDVIYKEIPVYIPADSCNLPPGFRVLHDAAAVGTIPSTAAIPNAEPVPVRTATETVTRNYETCHLIKADLELLRQWVLEQRELYLAECKQQGLNCN